MKLRKKSSAVRGLLIAAWLATAGVASADVVTEWDVRACDAVVAAGYGPAPANRVLAVVQSAVYEAVNAIARQYPAGERALEAPPDASIPAAVAAANRATLTALCPSQASTIEEAYEETLGAIADGPQKRAGITVGEEAARRLLRAREKDGGDQPEAYRPHTTPGFYVPTVVPVASQWPHRRPWLMTEGAQFRPGPPPPLDSDSWAQDLNETKSLGASDSTTRTAEQTRIAKFWEASLPPIYHGLLRSVAESPGRDVVRNARLFSAAAQATDDALIAVMDAKYHYQLWRPVTAIRNADRDGNDATERTPSWSPFIPTPMHPEYPCAHCSVSGAVGTVILGDIGSGPMPTLSTSSYTANGAVRSWASVEDLMQEVGNARIYDGVHYRTSNEVGTALGIKVGKLAVERFMAGVEE